MVPANQAVMSEREARACVEVIRSGLEDIRRAVLDLYERQGWRALGYANWRECVVTEFGQSESYIYRLADAARVDRAVSPIGETSIHVPESQARELAPLVKSNPEQAREVWRDVTEEAEETGQPVTAAKVREAVQRMTPKADTEPEQIERVIGEIIPDDDPRIDELKHIIRDVERCQRMRDDVFAVAFRNAAVELRKILREMERSRP